MLGEALIRPRKRTIEIAGEVRKIDHKALQLLLCLVDRAGVPVAKRELFDRVWKQEFVSDEVLTVGISRLRRALGDEARSPCFIETIPHVGYRLIAEVRSASPSSEAEASPSPGVTTRHFPWRRPLAVLAFVSVGLLAYFFVRAHSGAPEDAEEIRALAVLPLENLTGNPAQDHLADGMTEGLITGLAGQQRLRVVSRASVNRYEATRPELKDIARQLGVDAVVEGSVQRSGDRIRVSIRLIAAAERHLWATTMDGDMSRFLDLQEALVAEVVGRLRPGKASTSSAPAETVDPSAYESYLRGRYLLQHGSPASLERLENAVQHLETAIALAPDFGDAHAALAEAWLKLGERSLTPPGIAFPKVRTAAERLSALGQHPARAQALLATVLFLYDWDFAAAEEAFTLAIRLDPDEILARDGYSRFLTVMGRFDEALEQQRVLRDLNPLIYHQPYLAYIFNMARRHPSALAELQEQLQIERHSARLYSHLTSTHRWLGRPQDGRQSFRIYLRLSGASAQHVEQVDAAFAASGVVGVARLLARHLEQMEAQGHWIPAMSHAEVLTLAGDRDAAIEYLARAFENHEPDLLLIAQSPDYDSLRGDSRFQELSRQVFRHAPMAAGSETGSQRPASALSTGRPSSL